MNNLRRGFVAVIVLALTVTVFGSVVSAKRVNLRFLSPAWQPGTVRAVREIVAEWNRANPDIQVKIVWQTWEHVNAYLLTSFRAGDAPDLFHNDSIMFYEYGLMGFAAPLNEFLNEEILQDIPTRMWESVTDNAGTIYGVPFLQEVLTIFYNRALFADAGITVPADGIITWDELLDFARRLTVVDDAGEVTRWGLLSPLEQRLWWCLVRQNEGQILRRDDDGRWFVDIDERAEQALRFFVEMVTVHNVMPQDAVIYDFMTLLRGFLDGEYAMFTFGSWVRCWLERLGRDELEWGMMLLRGPRAVVTEAGPQALGIWADTPHKEEAVAFLQFFTNTENSARIAHADWLFPTRTTAIDRPEFRTEEHQWDVVHRWLPYAVDVRARMFGFFGWEWGTFLPEIELVILGKQDFETALANATVRGNIFLRRMGLQ